MELLLESSVGKYSSSWRNVNLCVKVAVMQVPGGVAVIADI